MTKHEGATHRSYFLVFAGLIVLAASSYGLSFAQLGAFTVPVAMSFSVAKVLLVAAFFMELVAQRFTNRFALVAAVVLAGTLIAFMAADALTRGTPPMLTP